MALRAELPIVCPRRSVPCREVGLDRILDPLASRVRRPARRATAEPVELLEAAPRAAGSARGASTQREAEGGTARGPRRNGADRGIARASSCPREDRAGRLDRAAPPRKRGWGSMGLGPGPRRRAGARLRKRPQGG